MKREREREITDGHEVPALRRALLSARKERGEEYIWGFDYNFTNYNFGEKRNPRFL